MATKKKAAKKAAKKVAKKTIKKKAAKRLSLAGGPAAGLTGISIDITFFLGGGEITATLSRNLKQIGQETIKKSGNISFPNALAGDELGIDGLCTGTAQLITNRVTVPVSSPASPRKYPGGNIFDSLGL